MEFLVVDEKGEVKFITNDRKAAEVLSRFLNRNGITVTIQLNGKRRKSK